MRLETRCNGSVDFFLLLLTGLLGPDRRLAQRLVVGGIAGVGDEKLGGGSGHVDNCGDNDKSKWKVPTSGVTCLQMKGVGGGGGTMDNMPNGDVNSGGGGIVVTSIGDVDGGGSGTVSGRGDNGGGVGDLGGGVGDLGETGEWITGSGERVTSGVAGG